MSSISRLRAAYVCAILLIAAALALALSQGGRIRSDFDSLLPQQAQPDALWQAAQQAQQQQLSAQILLLVGAAEKDPAQQAALALAQQWRNSGLFSQVEAAFVPDLPALQARLRRLGPAALPPEQAQLLKDDPAAYFRARAEAAVNPFATALLPLQKDWLGFARFLFTDSPAAAPQWDSASGLLISQAEDWTWVWLRAQPAEDHDAHALKALAADSRALLQAKGGRLLLSGGALFAADSKIQAERESHLMSAAGLGLTFALIAALWRSWRLAAVLLPLGIGILCGLAACIAVFGHIHALTLVIGSSLIGVLVDFPLHWLAPTLFRRPWQAEAAMRRIAPTFALSLGITAFGYCLLFFTPLPVLRQTAVFSAAALLGAFSATALLLPPLLRPLKPRQGGFAGLIEKLLAALRRLLRLPRPYAAALLGLCGLLLAAGLWQSRWQDDIRDWAALNPELLAHSREIAALAQMPASGRALLLDAADEEALLLAHRRLQAALPEMPTLAASAMPLGEQAALKSALAALADRPDSYADLLAIGIPAATIRRALLDAAAAPPVSLSEQLALPTAEAARHLYLGMVDGRALSLLPLPAAAAEIDLQALNQTLQCSGCLRLFDSRADINAMFAQTRDRAAWLKLLSVAAAWLLLWRCFGARQGGLMLLIPLAAAACTLAVFGWWGVTVGLFPMFGLLLAAAIGMDYTVYAFSLTEALPQKCAALCLAAASSGISFILLCFSATAAVAGFGAAVALGIGFNLFFTLILLLRREQHDNTAI